LYLLREIQKYLFSRGLTLHNCQALLHFALDDTRFSKSGL